VIPCDRSQDFELLCNIASFRKVEILDLCGERAALTFNTVLTVVFNY